MTEEQWLSTTSGFNDISCWMWGSQMQAEDAAVQSGILNWTSFMSPEALYGYASAYPLMRVEEMYFIEAEAAAHLNAGEGKTLLESFMNTYRDESYVCENADVVDEVLLQKRIELWGEGTTFFDIKRLNLSVTPGQLDQQTWVDAYGAGKETRQTNAHGGAPFGEYPRCSI